MAKNVKQSKQKKSVLNKLGGLSKRSKFIVVVLIFAVLGGGYLTYKSFAATAGTNPISEVAADSIFSGEPGCNRNIIQDPAKNNMRVMQIYCPPGKSYSLNNTYLLSGYPVKWPQGTYKNCVTAKGVGKLVVDGSSDIASPWNSTHAGYRSYNINSPDYKEYCSYPITIGRAGIEWYRSNLSIFNKIPLYNGPVSDSVTLMTISYMTKYWYAPGAAPAPSGGK